MSNFLVTPNALCPPSLLQHGRIYTVSDIEDNKAYFIEKVGAEGVPITYIAEVLYDEHGNTSYLTMRDTL